MAVFTMRGIDAGPDGIVWYSDDELDRSVWTRVRRAADGRNEVSELYLSPDERSVSTDDLRRIPIGRIEAWANSAEGREQIEERRGNKRVALSDYCTEQLHKGDEINKRLKRAQQQRRKKTAHGVPLELPKPAAGQNRGDDFYKAVARLYERLTDEGRSPGTVIANANEVPPSTARRWIKESRARGFLGPGRVGKAG